MRQAQVRREFPNGLRVLLAGARRGRPTGAPKAAAPLVNSRARSFEANRGRPGRRTSLPRLHRRPSAGRRVLAHVPRAGSRVGSRWTAAVDALQLTARGSWRVELDSGARAGAGQRHARRSACSACSAWCTRCRTWRSSTRRRVDALEYADLRHDSGYALRLRGVTTVSTDARRRRASAQAPRAATGRRRTTEGRTVNYGKRIQRRGRGAGHRHRQGHGRGGRGVARWRAQAGRPGRRRQQRLEARRGGQYRRHGAEHPAGAEGGRADGRLQDPARLYRHHRQPYPRASTPAAWWPSRTRKSRPPTWPA